MTRTFEELEGAYDAEFYREAYPDLASLTAEGLRAHWLGCGAAEGRWASSHDLAASHPEVDVSGFDPAEFLFANPDLPSMSVAAATIYWVLYGWKEGREKRCPAIPAAVLRRLAGALLADPGEREKVTDPRTLVRALRAVPEEALPGELFRTDGGASERVVVVALFERIHGRVPSPREVTLSLAAMACGGSRGLLEAIVRGAFHDPETRRILSGGQPAGDGPGEDPRAFTPLGTGREVPFTEWEARHAAAPCRPLRPGPPGTGQEAARVPVLDPVAPPVVSILCSLYGGGRHIDSYLANLTGQEGFRDHELIVVDACSPEGEGLVVKEYARSFPGVVYRRETTRVGIYEAWNTALRMARGRYVTNANLDDSRRPDSLAVMARALDALPEVDVVYSDVFYTLVPHLPWETIASIGIRTDLPPLTTWNLLDFNSPHCAPMWRRSLHDRFGGFDASFSSAGDWEFWLRSAERGALFHKLPEPLVAYTFNPEGISTRRGTAGIREQWPIRERYRKLLVQPERGLDPLRPMSPSVPARGPRGETTP